MFGIRRIDCAFWLATAFISLASVVATMGQEMHVFSDKSGQELEASIVGLSPDKTMLKIRRADDRFFDLEILRLSLKDQQYIREWLDQNPESMLMAVAPDVEFTIEVAANRTELKRERETYSSSTKLHSTPTLYTLTVTNKSRETLPAPILEYFFLVEDEVELIRDDGLFTYDSAPRYSILVKSGTIQLEDLSFNRDQEVTTITIPIEEVLLDGNQKYLEDEIIGLVGVIKDASGKIVTEFTSGESSIARYKFSTLVEEFGEPTADEADKKPGVERNPPPLPDL